MNNQYYIDINGARDGPHDLVTMMRRIRAGKITMDTLIFIDDSVTSLPADQVPDLKVFFSRDDKVRTAGDPTIKLFTLRSAIHEGWRFTMRHNIMTVFAGGMVLLSALATAPVVDAFGSTFGTMFGWVMFMILHSVYLVFTLRMYRGQPIGADFVNHHLSPVLSTLLIASICIAFMIAGGFFALVIPAFFIAVYYVFVPFFIIDRRMGMIQAMEASRLLFAKFNRRYADTIIMLVLAYLGSMILIVPLPLTTPMFAAALSKIYEDMSTA